VLILGTLLYLKVVQLVLSQGWTCLRAGLVQALWGQTCLRAGLVSGPDLSKHFGTGGVQKLQGWKCLAAGSVPKFRAGSVSRPDLVRGRKCLGAEFYYIANSRYSTSTNFIPSTKNRTSGIRTSGDRTSGGPPVQSFYKVFAQ
jgi:hypothetical protein